MKYISGKFLITSLLLLSTIKSNSENVLEQDSLFINFYEAGQIMREHSLLLLAKSYDIKTAEANLKQERLFENPDLSIQHNVNNPVTNRYFETGYDGETDIQLSQRIFIGGQRSERIRRSKFDVMKSQYEYDDVCRLMRRDLYKAMSQLYFTAQKEDIIKREIKSVDNILSAYLQQLDKGNVAEMEVVRIKNLRLQLIQEQAELNKTIAEWQKDIRLMLGTGDSTVIKPNIRYDDIVTQINSTSLNNLVMSSRNRPDLVAGKYEIESGEHEIKLQKANGLPEISIAGEWDKNGNIGHNFFSVGLSLSLPVFNRNQGAVKAAKADLESKRLQQQWNIDAAKQEISTKWEHLMSAKKLVEELDEQIDGAMEYLIQNVENQYKKRNISLLELMDYYESYKNTYYLMLDSKCDVVMTYAELDFQ